MEHNLSKRMLEIATAENKSNSKFNLASFLIQRDEIYEAINDGWSVKYIWEVLYKDKKIKFSYQTFLNFVNKYKPDIVEITKQNSKKKNELPDKLTHFKINNKDSSYCIKSFNIKSRYITKEIF